MIMMCSLRWAFHFSKYVHRNVSGPPSRSHHDIFLFNKQKREKKKQLKILGNSKSYSNSDNKLTRMRIIGCLCQKYEGDIILEFGISEMKFCHGSISYFVFIYLLMMRFFQSWHEEVESIMLLLVPIFIFKITVFKERNLRSLNIRQKTVKKAGSINKPLSFLVSSPFNDYPVELCRWGFVHQFGGSRSFLSVVLNKHFSKGIRNDSFEIAYHWIMID